MSKTTGNEINILASLGIKPLSKAANYREWRLAVIDILAEKGYLEIVSGKSKRPDNTPSESSTGGDTATASGSTAQAKKTADKDAAETLSKWELKSSKARGMLGRLLDTAHRELYAEVRDPKELWEKLEKRYAGKDQARIWFLREELSKVEYHDDNLVDYISSLLLSKLPLPYHPFRTTTWNDSKYDDTAYDDICDRLILEHQQLTRGDAETEATNAFYAGKGKKKDNGKRGWKLASQAEGTSEKRPEAEPKHWE